MKFSLVFLAVVAVIGCVLSCSDKEFADFKAKFNKQYGDARSENHHKEVFCENLKKIEAHNRLYEQGKSSYKQGINQFSDMTQKEFENSGYVMRPGFSGKV